MSLNQKIHLGRKEALEVMAPFGVGRGTLQLWIDTVPGLHVTLRGRRRGHIVRVKLMEQLQQKQN